MKTNQMKKSIVLALVCFTTTSSLLMSQTSANMLQLYAPITEKKKTTAERLADLQSRHSLAFADLSANLNRLPTEPDLLGTKALFTMVDQTTREMKNIRSGCSLLMSSLRADAKTIGSSGSFTDKEKEELYEAAEALAKQCVELSKTLDKAIERLGAAYTIFPKWNSVHKSYRSLQGETKASQVIKSHVDEYLKSFTPETNEATDKPAQEADEVNAESDE